MVLTVFREGMDTQMTRIMVTGTYDLFHAGHVRLLKEARKHGEKIYVGVRSDARAKRTKGKLRPVYSLQQRLEILNACKYVTEARPIPGNDTFSSRTGIRKLMERWKPDIWIDGAQGSAAKHAEPLSKEYGFEYIQLNCELVHTTQIIQKIVNYFRENPGEEP